MLVGKNLTTEFATSGRLHQDAVLVQHEKLLLDKKLRLFYDFSPDFVVVLNEYRQIIFANKTLLSFLEKKDAKEIIGARPGELFRCKAACCRPGGCGTSIYCRECGVVKAVLAANYTNIEIEECCIQTKDEEVYNFRVWASCPWNDYNYTLLIIRDIADEKFRNALEQTFFHDLTNAATDMQGLLELIDSPRTYNKYSPMLSSISREMIEEINGQRDLRYAEEGIIMIKKSPMRALELINNFVGFYKDQKIADGIKLIVSDDSEDISFSSDERLILRVIENMIKNALEASHKGQTVTATCRKKENNAVFSVHNPNFMEEAVQLNIFKRSFSTKGHGRGWGTYSMKLLTERYLNGKVSFTSTKKDGTTFYAEYPLE